MRIQEIDDNRQEQLRHLIKYLNSERGIQLSQFCDNIIKYHMLKAFQQGKRNFSEEKFERLLENVNKYLDSLK